VLTEALAAASLYSGVRHFEECYPVRNKETTPWL
jgi:hypothetical protein